MKTTDSLDNHDTGACTDLPPRSHDRAPDEKLFLTSERLGRLWSLGNEDVPGSAGQAINERIYRRAPMPPSIRLPGNRQRLWYLPTVIKWMRAFEGPSAKRKPGRPRNAQKVLEGSKRPTARR